MSHIKRGVSYGAINLTNYTNQETCNSCVVIRVKADLSDM